MKGVHDKLNTLAAEAKIINFRPLLFTAVFFALGILLAYLCGYANVSYWWLCSIIPLFGIGAFFFIGVYPLRKMFCAVLALALAFAVGFGALRLQLRAYTSANEYKGEYQAVGRVVETVEMDGVLRLTLDRVHIQSQRENGKLVVYLPASFSEIRLADKVLVSGRIRTVATAQSVYYANENIKYVMNAERCTVVGHTFDVFLAIKNRLKTVLNAGMEDQAAAVAMAVMAGDTSGIQTETLENMRRGGIAHIFAVSGLHIGALFAFCVWLTQKTKLKMSGGLVRFSFVAIVLLFYGGVCGYSSSVVRAITTCLTLYATKLLVIGSDALERVAISAIVVLLFSPISLFSVGFQLTYTACLGILLLNRPIYQAIDGTLKTLWRCITHSPKPVKRVDGERHPPTIKQEIYRKCLRFFAVTLSAQVAAAPILLHAFGYLSLWSLLLNCLFVPLVSATFSLLFSLSAIACALPLFCSKFLLYVPSVIWSLTLFVFEIVDFSAFCIENVVLSVGSVGMYYIGLLFLTDKWNMGKKVKFLLVIVCFVSAFFVLFLAN